MLDLKVLRKATVEEVAQIAKEQWQSPRMQEYIKKTYDYYFTQDGYYLEFEKVNKISMRKDLYYDDEYDAPQVNETNFILENRHNFPAGAIDEYLKEYERLMTNGCATGLYDYKGIRIYKSKDNTKEVHYRLVRADNRPYFENCFVRYLTDEEKQDLIDIEHDRQAQYIERLKRYFKRYSNKIYAIGYWANR